MEECTAEEVQRLLPLVAPFRREQALKYKHTFGQFCCLKAWEMLEKGLRETGNALRDRRFTRLWTQKEAIVKCMGTGIESFEQLQGIRNQESGIKTQTIETEKYIYSIAYE